LLCIHVKSQVKYGSKVIKNVNHCLLLIIPDKTIYLPNYDDLSTHLKNGLA
jgi:hypothetical protein